MLGAARRGESFGGATGTNTVCTHLVRAEAELRMSDPLLQSHMTRADGKLIEIIGNTPTTRMMGHISVTG